MGDRSFYCGDIADGSLLERVVAEHPDFDATIDMAARVVVGESVAEPYLYYRDNVAKSLELLDRLSGLEASRSALILSVGARLLAVVRGRRVGASRPAVAIRPDWP